MSNKISSLSAGTKTLKRLLLLVAIFATISPLWNGVMAEVTGPEWGKEDGEWYIFNSTLSGNSGSESNVYDIYLPNCSTTINATYAGAGGVLPVSFGISIDYVSNNPNYILTYTSEGWSGSFSVNANKDILYAGSHKLRLAWGYVNQQRKSLSVNIPLPLHLDYIKTQKNLDVIQIGNDFSAGNVISYEIDMMQYIMSYYISDDIELSIQQTQGNGSFSFSNSGNVTTAILADEESSNGDAVYANITGTNGFKIGSIAPFTVYYTAGAAGGATPTALITIHSKDFPNNDKTITITAEPNKTFIFGNAGAWNVASNWIAWPNGKTANDIPGEDDDVSIRAACSIPENYTTAKCNNMEITATGSLLINATSALSAKGTVNNETDSKIQIKATNSSSGTFIFHNECGYGPHATVEMYIPQTTETASTSKNWKDYIWRYMGSPVESGSPSDVQYIFEWDESDSGDGDEDGWYECWQQVTNNPITAWTGYAMGSTADPIHTITGQLTNCDVELPMDFASDPVSSGVDKHNHADRGNNLITNSYSAPIQMSQMLESDFPAEATVYFYHSGTHADWVENASETGFNEGTSAGQFTAVPIYSNGAINSNLGTIPSGQAFFVEASASGQNFNFRYETVAQSASGPAYAPRKQEEFNVLGISVVGTDSLRDLLWLMENENCSEKFDNGYDGTKKIGTEGTPQLYATTEFGRTSVNVDQTLTGQYLGFMAGKNGVHYTIYFNTDRLEGYESLYLYDTKENKYANIMKGESYTFTGLRSGEEKRFLIVGQRDEEEDDVVVRTGDEQRIEVVGNRALVMGFDGSDSDVRVIDMQGKVVCTWSMKEGPWFELPDLPGGVYVISVDKCQTKFVK